MTDFNHDEGQGRPDWLLRVLFLFVLLCLVQWLSGCDDPGVEHGVTINGSNVHRFTDTDAGVTCWTYSGGISCLRNQ